MYKIRRDGGRTVITDWAGQIVFSTEDDALVIYRDDSGLTMTAKVSSLSDVQLLKALASPVKIDL